MSTKIDETLRESLISDPKAILDDPALMQALMAANDQAKGDNVVDLRGVAMNRLAGQLDQLADKHRSVVAAAYENMAGTQQIHRAVLQLLEAPSLADFTAALKGSVSKTLQVDALQIAVEGAAGPMISVAPGFIETYLTHGRPTTPRPVTLRQVPQGSETLYGDVAGDIRSEACLLLNLGDGRPAALMAMGACDPNTFAPQQGTDLLAFFAGVVERGLRRWLP